MAEVVWWDCDEEPLDARVGDHWHDLVLTEGGWQPDPEVVRRALVAALNR